MVRRIVLWAPVVVYMAAIFYESSLSQAPLPPAISDKTGHTLGYVGLGVLIVRALAGGLPARIGARVMAIAALMTIAYGVSDEVHQLYVPGRSADIYDVYADALGAAIALIVCWGWGIIACRSAPRGTVRHDL